MVKIAATINKKASLSPPKVELFSTLTFDHEGEQPSETKVDLYGALIDKKQGATKHQQINLKGAVVNGPGGKSGIVCFDIDNQLNTNWVDPLDYTGQSEPEVNQTITLRMGTFPSGEPTRQTSVQDLPCLTNHAEVTFTGEAKRSADQVMEADAAAIPPYNLCNGDKASGLWPGKFIPPTRSCQVKFHHQKLHLR